MEKTQLQLEYLKEQYAQARQHETLRTNTTTFLTAATGVVLGFTFKDGIFQPSILIGLIAALIGTANYLINEAHFTGNRFHTTLAGKVRSALESGISDWSAGDKPSELRGKAREKEGIPEGVSIGQIVHERVQWVPKGVVLVGILLAVASTLQSPIISAKMHELTPSKTQQVK